MLTFRHQLEVVACDLDCGVEPLGRRIQLSKLQFDTFADGARSHPRGVESLNARQHGLYFRGIALDLGTQRPRDLLDGLGDVAVVADGIDDRSRYRQLARLQLGELELP